jgi:hypothetical protein
MSRIEQCKEIAEEILQEFTNCYSEADEDVLVKMLNNMACNFAKEIFAELEKWLSVGGDIRIITGKKFAELKERYTEVGK